MQPQQPGYNSLRVYLELLADLPWKKATEEHELDLKAAKERLDSDHYGLVKVKQRIIEYLAVRKVTYYLIFFNPQNFHLEFKFFYYMTSSNIYSLSQMQEGLCCALLGHQVWERHLWHHLLLLLWEENLSAYPWVVLKMRLTLEDIGGHTLEACQGVLLMD